MPPHQDRRVRRTRTELHRALIELLTEKGYDRVSVQDILDRADVGRSTFYHHFRDKDDLLVVSCTEYMQRAVEERARGRSSPWEPVRTVFDLCEEYPRVYAALAGRRSDAVLVRATAHMVREVLTRHLGAPRGADDAALDPAVQFLAWGIVGLFGPITAGKLTAAQAFATFEAAAQPWRRAGSEWVRNDATAAVPPTPTAAVPTPGSGSSRPAAPRSAAAPGSPVAVPPEVPGS
ncbi:TetR/AcrR family transcriptional regulator [Rhodococcus rhodochrous]|uniref:TetR/AcrR family transcriptional regulator n=1 Tax=Rhodococcus rhodochrous TaxID=1829 RepID=UPI00128EEB69|nr:TetR/AcrR family transcriptional regulator [Rhodococcus rhodochrous]